MSDNYDSVVFAEGYPPSAGGKQGSAGQFLALRVDLTLRRVPGGSDGEVFRGWRVDEIAWRLVDDRISFGRRARRRERWSAGLMAEMAQDSLDGRRLHHRGDDPHPAVEPRAVESVDEENPLQQVWTKVQVG